MDDVLNQIENLIRQLDSLQSRQLQMNNEMSTLKKQLTTLKASVSPSTNADETYKPVLSSAEEQPQHEVKYLHQVKQELKERKRKSILNSFHVTQELEDFIGTNLISKVGILITIIGVFIGAKYAIDKELISPAMRIILSYLFAAALFFVAWRLKPKYENFSSILMAGGLAVTYFVTYIAFSFYQLFPQGVAFAMMIVTTAAAVVVSLWYNLKVIALIGQVAAYAIPFLLGDGSGNVSVLFTYISIINIGLLVLSFKKDWKILYHIAFFLTWTIYAFWILSSNNTAGKLSTGLLFLSINFFTFYVTFLSYKIIRKQMYKIEEIVILLLNALFLFLIGTYLINENFDSYRPLTWFTLANAAIHFGVGYFVYRLKLTDKTVFRFILGLGLLFVTVAMPIEFDGSWVTLLWTVEATTLVYIAFSQKREMYLRIAFPLAIFSLLSLLQDWSYAYPHIKGIISNKITIKPFSNLNFWLSLFVCSCFGFMSYHSTKNIVAVLSVNTRVFFSKVVPVIFMVLLYFSFYNELHLVWDLAIQQDQESEARSNYPLLQTLTLLVFSCMYIAAFIWANFKWIKKADINSLLLTAAGVANLVMIFKGLYVLGELRDVYLQHQLASPSFSSIISIRYFFFAALAIIWLSAWRVIKAQQISASIQIFFSLFFNFTLLSIICNEFVHWMDLSGYSNEYKLGLSIICGMHALALVFAGILKKKKHLRISGMFLFGLTLLKLFFYDMSSLSAISKTIVLLMLGILLLVASFLYNKYKGLLFTKED